MPDKIITCQNCGQEFAWTSDEQEFYASKNLSQPKHCMICRSILKNASSDKFRGKSKFEK
jgi:putative zinc ribbon protein